MKKLFTNDKFFAFVTWFSVLSIIPYVIVVTILYENPLIRLENVVRLLNVILLAWTYVSYKKHEKNVMKGLIGATLITLAEIAVTSYFINEASIYRFLSILIGVVVFALFISHFIINSDHNSRPVHIYINQILSVVFAIIAIVSFITLVSTCVNAADVVVTILAGIGQPFCILSIICVESRLDAYRLDREKAGWTEEKGYPEGYVHEFEKK